MAHFYGTLQGNRGEATRCGTQASGLETIAASWNGAVRVKLYVNHKGQDCARIHLMTWNGVGLDRELFDGPVNCSAGIIRHK